MPVLYRFPTLRSCLAALAASGLCVSVSRAQEIPKPDYITYMPRELPRLVEQQQATALFQLYGDPQAPGYVDQHPLDGIDDRRGEWFTQVAVRFAPWMVRNTVDFPMDWRRFVNRGASFPLFWDVFDVSRAAPRLASSATIDFRLLAGHPCTVPAAQAANDTLPDCKLVALLERFGPDARATPLTIPPDRAELDVLYFDFPGQDPASWNREYEGYVQGAISRPYVGWAKTFVHPFITIVGGRPVNDPRYELVLQYWFFYPYNDAGNIHEGDWEHINVVVTTRAQGAAPFTEAEMRQFLASPPPIDELLIREVQYYFHSWVFTFDYWEPNVYLPREEWEKQRDALKAERFGEKEIWTQLRRQAYLDDAETKINTHPVIFIGGDNRGLQQLIAKPTRLGRASHGSYPLVGLYRDVGPGGTGELVQHPWNLFRHPPDSTAPETEPLVRYDNSDRIELVPDWERVWPLVRTDVHARELWAWLTIPVRFGYPATRSPFAGIVSYAETGNLSIPAPPFNPGWNRAGAGAGYASYQPHRLSPFFPTSLQDDFRTGWGFFNLTLPALATLPGLDLIALAVSAPFRAASKSSPPKFFISETVPFRFIGASGGVSAFSPSGEWLSLFGFPEVFDPLLGEVRRLVGSDTINILTTEPDNEKAVMWLVGINLYLGRRFVAENSLQHSNSQLSTPTVIQGVSGTVPLTANLDFWEYVGSLRYNLAIGGFQPFVKAGYGLSWYRLENARLGNTILGDGTTRWVRQPSLFDNLLPNTWHVGAGFEYIPIRSVGGVDFGVKADVAWFTHNLGVVPSDSAPRSITDVRIYRWVVTASGNLSF